MSIETAADRLAFLSADDFGTEATYTPVGGDPTEGIAGIFDSPAFTVSMEHADTIDARPSFFCREDDLPDGAAAGVADTVLIEIEALDFSQLYEVATIEPDGQGMTRLTLAKANLADGRGDGGGLPTMNTP